MNILNLLYLFESRDQYIIKNQGAKLLAANNEFDSPKLDSAEDIVQKLMQADPSKNNQNLQWLANNYIKKQFRLEDVNRVKDELTKFHSVKNRMPVKDLNRMDYHQFSDQLSDVFDNVELDNDVNVNSNDIKVLYDGPFGTLSVPLSQGAACELGRGTKWCTASRNEHNMFDHYNDDGTLYVWRDKSGAKFQFHFETGQVMDARDREVELEGLAKLLEIPPVRQLFSQNIPNMNASLLFNMNTQNGHLLHHEFAKQRAKSEQPILFASIPGQPDLTPEEEDRLFSDVTNLSKIAPGQWHRYIVKHRPDDDSRETRGGRKIWPRFEEFLKRGLDSNEVSKSTIVQLASMYAIANRLEEFKFFEDLILNYYNLGGEKNPELVYFPTLAINYASKVLYSRWPEAESIMKLSQNQGMWEDYSRKYIKKGD